MGFEDIHQPKLNVVFCFRVNPWLFFCFLARQSLTLPF